MRNVTLRRLSTYWALALLVFAMGLPPAETAYAATPEAALRNASGTSPDLPDVIHWCAKHCITLIWQNGHYTNAEEPDASEWILDSFTKESFAMHRTDYQVKTGETVVVGKAVLSGRISEQGSSVADGKITWTYHPCCGTGTSDFTAAWGSALNAVPGSDQERDHRQAGLGSPRAWQAQNEVTIAVVLDQEWTDTGIVLKQGQSVKVKAHGMMNWYTGACNGKCTSTPAGISCPGGEPMRYGLPCQSLLGRIGSDGKSFEVGESTEFTASAPGKFFLGVNDNNLSDNTGTWTATISSPSDFALVKARQQALISIALAQPWTDTGVYLAQGQQVTINARGTMNWYTGACDGKCLSTPAGIPCPGGGPKRLGLTCLSLIAGIGVSGKPFDVGDSLTFTAPHAGELFLGVNDDNLSDNTGNWTVTINSPIAFVQWAQTARVRQELLALQQAQGRNQLGIGPGLVLLGVGALLLLGVIGGSSGEAPDSEDADRRERELLNLHTQAVKKQFNIDYARERCENDGNKSACDEIHAPPPPDPEPPQ